MVVHDIGCIILCCMVVHDIGCIIVCCMVVHDNGYHCRMKFVAACFRRYPCFDVIKCFISCVFSSFRVFIMISYVRARRPSKFSKKSKVKMQKNKAWNSLFREWVQPICLTLISLFLAYDSENQNVSHFLQTNKFSDIFDLWHGLWYSFYFNYPYNIKL